MKRTLLIALSSSALTLGAWLLADQPATQPVACVDTPSGMKIEYTASGESVAKAGDHVWIHYTGRFENGEVFESSVKSGEPIEFVLGTGRVIQGWEEGLTGMCVGEKRRLTIPSALAYGERGSGKIPPNATLVFDVQLMGLLRK